jgi:hypothetical protein
VLASWKSYTTHLPHTFGAHAREDNKWIDLNLRKVIPLDILDPAELVDLATEDDMEDLS